MKRVLSIFFFRAPRMQPAQKGFQKMTQPLFTETHNGSVVHLSGLHYVEQNNSILVFSMKTTAPAMPEIGHEEMHREGALMEDWICTLPAK